jgi:MFS superfamily sulfate permease-like transporter
MIGLGAANLAAGLFQGFPISSSSSRTPVAEAAGAKTQLTGVVGAVAVALLLVYAPNLLKDLPSSALAAVVIAAAIALFEFALASHLPHSAMGVLVVHCLLCRRCRVWRDSRHRHRDSHRGH